MSRGGAGEVTTLTAFAHAIRRKGGPGGDYTQEVVRVSSAKTKHLTMVLRVRPCSQTTRLSCVAEGGPFFAAAAPAGARAPLITVEKYAFLKVRRAGAPVPGGRKTLGFP